MRSPDLIIVDGLVGAEGIAGGVGFQHPVHAEVMLAGDDPVAVDVVARDLMMMTWRTRNLQWAIEDGLGIGDPQRIRVVGETVASCVKRRLIGAAEELQEALPGLQVHDRNACSGCRAFANTALHRFAHQKLLKPLHVIVGSEGDAPQVEGRIIVVGDCAKGCSHLGATDRRLSGPCTRDHRGAPILGGCLPALPGAGPPGPGWAHPAGICLSAGKRSGRSGVCGG